MSAAHLIQLPHHPHHPHPPPPPPLGVCAAEFRAHYHCRSASGASVALKAPAYALCNSVSVKKKAPKSPLIGDKRSQLSGTLTPEKRDHSH